MNNIKIKRQGDVFRVSGTGTLQEVLAMARDAAFSYAATKPLLTSPAMVRNFLHGMLASKKDHEIFAAILLDTQNRLIAYEELFRGTLDSCAVHPREVVKLAIASNAASIIFAHNHPSGHAEPSMADRAITERLKSALALIDVRVLDHLVVGEGETVSLAERGWI